MRRIWSAARARDGALGGLLAFALSLTAACSPGPPPPPANEPGVLDGRQEASAAEPGDALARPTRRAKALAELPDVAVVTPSIRDARDEAQGTLLREGEALLPDLPPLGAPEPQGVPGHFVKLIEPSTHRSALDHFHEALARLEAGEDPDGKVRVAFYGASGTAADMWTGYIRRYFQARFGDAGPGMVAAAKHTKWYHHRELSIRSSHQWVKEHPFTRSKRDDRFGWMQVSMSARAEGAWSEIGPKESNPDLRVDHFEVWYLAQPGGGTMRLYVDGKPAGKVDTSADDFAPGYHRVDVVPGAHTLRVSVAGDGEVRLFGVVAESDRPGVVLDTLGIDGARATVHTGSNEHLWAEHARRRAPDLYVLAYGTNESTNENESREAYEARLRGVLVRFKRHLPDASCVLMAPGDAPRREHGQVVARPHLREIIEVQHEVGAEMGCAVWPAREFMGGELAKLRWSQMSPAYARHDLVHLTRFGMLRLGMAVSDALLQRYDWEQVEARRRDARTASLDR